MIRCGSYSRPVIQWKRLLHSKISCNNNNNNKTTNTLNHRYFLGMQPRRKTCVHFQIVYIHFHLHFNWQFVQKHETIINISGSLCTLLFFYRLAICFDYLKSNRKCTLSNHLSIFTMNFIQLYHDLYYISITRSCAQCLSCFLFPLSFSLCSAALVYLACV